MTCDNCINNNDCTFRCITKVLNDAKFNCNHFKSGISFQRKHGNELGETEIINVNRKQIHTFNAIELNGRKFNNFMEMCEYITQLEEENKRLKTKLKNVDDYLSYDIPHELMNEATAKIWRML